MLPKHTTNKSKSSTDYLLNNTTLNTKSWLEFKKAEETDTKSKLTYKESNN